MDLRLIAAMHGCFLIEVARINASAAIDHLGSSMNYALSLALREDVLLVEVTQSDSPVSHKN